jgi:hypothetical protein
MIEFVITGSLPAPWEDFLPQSHDHPHFTIVALRAPDQEDGCSHTEPGVFPDGDWVNIYLDVELIDEPTARLEIANYLKVPPDQISIVQQDECQAA